MSMTHIPLNTSDYQVIALEGSSSPAREYKEGVLPADQPQRHDASTGLPIWETQAAITHDGELAHNGKIKVLSATQPEFRPMTPMRLEKLRVTPWVDERAQKPRVQLSWAVVTAPTMPENGGK